MKMLPVSAGNMEWRKMNFGVLLKSFVNLIVGIVVVILGLRFIFRLFAANAGNGLVEWVYNSSAEIMSPFRGIFPTATVDGSVIDFPALFAIFIYMLIGFFVIYIIDSLTVSTTKRRR